MVDRQELLRSAFKRAAAALKAADVPFALAGGYALWAHGAPEPDHDVDLAVPEECVERAAAVLAEVGFTIERPPEDWLFKAFLDGVFVDVLHRIVGEPVHGDSLERADLMDVLGLHLPVLSAMEIVTAKLRAMTERNMEFPTLLAMVRAVREQLDWPELQARTESNPFAEAFLLLADRLGISAPVGDADIRRQRMR